MKHEIVGKSYKVLMVSPVAKLTFSSILFLISLRLAPGGFYESVVAPLIARFSKTESNHLIQNLN